MDENLDHDLHINSPIEVQGSELMMGVTSCSFAMEKQRPFEKYNVHAYPFIPTISPPDSVSRILKITRPGSNLASLFALCAVSCEIAGIM